MTRARDHIASMAGYALADLTAPDGKPLISLAQNECLRGPSPQAVAAAQAALAGAELYPDPDWRALRHALAALHAIPADRILCGNGSLDLIGALARCFAGPDRAALAPAHAYPFFRTATLLAEARFDTAPEEAATVSVSALLDSVRPDTGLVLVANPGNPTGTRIPRAELARLRAGLRPDILLVIDEAYGEFADGLDAPSFDMVPAGNTVVLRTLSKAYGMAGFRVGWGLFPELVAAEICKVLNPNNISAMAQAAAVAALADQAYMRDTCRMTARLRDDASARLTAAGLRVLPSFTNFLLIDMGSAARARAADAALRRDGILLRQQAGAGLPHALRMTIGPAAAVDTAVTALVTWTRETSR